ncbi:alkaline phosphatase-like protein [Acephala macrosclerotiorum]|nr:alkaline phosphatase-like protein [Acephala macrosclerotiorum]
MASKRANFLIIVADDLGFSDLSCFGESIRFTDFHAAAACSPSRAMIMTGTDHHIAGLGNLIEWTNISGQNDPNMPGYEGYLNERVVTLPEMLRDAGYLTLLAWKWHLGLTPERSPKARGFERSFAHLPACSNHYAYEPQLESSDKIPDFMTMSFVALHSEDGEYVKKLPDGWYSSDGYGDKMLKYLKERKESKDERPFFGYFPFTAPHWPLQAPPEYVAHYKGVYDDGPDALRLKRLQRLKDLGMVDKDVEPHPVVAEEVKEWADFIPKEKAKSLVDYLEETGEIDNTFVCFMSDNGAEGAAYEAYPIVQGSMIQHLKKYYNNSLDNLGNGGSFIWYGPRWAQAATAPSRLYKAYTTEGGIRVPFLAKFPSGTLKVGTEDSITHTFGTVMDLAPTILEIAGVTHPAPTYQGREVVHMRGRSMLQFIEGKSESIHDKDFINDWETCGRAAVRRGDYKIVFIPKPKGSEKWQLYNLAKDPGEIHDLAEQDPERLEKMVKVWDQYVLETGVIPLAPELGDWFKASEEQMPENVWMEYEYWQDGAREKPEEFMRHPPRFQRVVKAI